MNTETIKGGKKVDLELGQNLVKEECADYFGTYYGKKNYCFSRLPEDKTCNLFCNPSKRCLLVEGIAEHLQRHGKLPKAIECSLCKALFTRKSNNQTLCPECAKQERLIYQCRLMKVRRSQSRLFAPSK